jgi:hypothetical protein
VAGVEARTDGADSIAGASGGGSAAAAAATSAAAAAVAVTVAASTPVEWLSSLSSMAAPSSVESVCMLAWIAAALSNDAPPGL